MIPYHADFEFFQLEVEVERLRAINKELVEALAAYLKARPQCECSDHSGCSMAAARVKARAAIAKAKEQK
jgi:hypothetical protein